MLIVTSFLAIVFPILVFFNLYYSHDYYLASVTPFIAIVTGCGLHQLLCVRFRGKAALQLAVVVLIGFSYFKGAPYAIDTLRADTTTHEAYRLGLHLRELTGADERIVISGYDWNPAILYYARRKGYMHSRPDRPFPYEMFKHNNFSVLVYRSRGAGDSANLGRLLSGWQYHLDLGTSGRFRIFRVTDAPPRGPG